MKIMSLLHHQRHLAFVSCWVMFDPAIAVSSSSFLNPTINPTHIPTFVPTRQQIFALNQSSIYLPTSATIGHPIVLSNCNITGNVTGTATQYPSVDPTNLVPKIPSISPSSNPLRQATFSPNQIFKHTPIKSTRFTPHTPTFHPSKTDDHSTSSVNNRLYSDTPPSSLNSDLAVIICATVTAIAAILIILAYEMRYIRYYATSVHSHRSGPCTNDDSSVSENVLRGDNVYPMHEDPPTREEDFGNFVSTRVIARSGDNVSSFEFCETCSVRDLPSTHNLRIFRPPTPPPTTSNPPPTTWGYFFNVVAPPGRLHVFVDTPTGYGPIVRFVDAESPLANQLQTGDRLLALDGRSMKNLSALEASKLIRRKCHHRQRIFTVLRPRGIEGTW
uniref:PDZ domain-containing protein n=1 Tax=Corethron hystrix TaxID=216773 RepID=A0A7S1FL49_9STRA|mmetsp:Transcript_13130/g.28923  ORF Transcript_13130/g.28923 Transcript_13130/m.28923 type:complete len:388 (+) Transcript_13130:149-1312(+)